MMKTLPILSVAMGLSLVACQKSEETPKAQVVEETEAKEVEAAPAPELVEPAPVEPEPTPELGEAPIEPLEEEDEKKSVGDHVDGAIDATGHGLKTAGEKTEEGLRKATEATGGFIKRMGEKLEDVATPDEETTEEEE